jgi:hypothetical protein
MGARLRVVEPSNENRSVPTRPSNAELRSREYLTAGEVEKLMKAARKRTVESGTRTFGRERADPDLLDRASARA